MKLEVDFYDVMRMIEEEASRLRGAIADLRADVNAIRDSDGKYLSREAVEALEAARDELRRATRIVAAAAGPSGATEKTP